MSAVTQSWVAPQGLRIPDFIICGAMKCGTTTLHHVLDQHPRVYVAKGEVHFFDMDSPLHHPRFSYFNGREWRTPRLEDDPHRYWEWYSSHFAGATADQIVGEDSTLYMLSETAAQRIAAQPKPIRLLILLRHPTHRAYSQYWHMLVNGRARYSFEETLRYEPYTVLNRSLYVQQLRSFLAHVERERVKVVLFEDLVADRPAVLREVCGHIGVDYGQLPADSLDIHYNRSRLPRFPGLQLTMNKLFRGQATLPVGPRVPTALTSRVSAKVAMAKAAHKAYRAVNPLTDRRPPAMRESTRRFLDDYFRKELEGIDELVGRSVWSTWFERDG
ncbi:MAG: sulfotransferase [Thermoleophilia bacterium]|nr:sulfotransferase [Thermoleophilia bacterium]